MSTVAATATSEGTHAKFIRSRLGSLLAVFPLGVWTASHLWSNLAAFRGAGAWQDSVTHHAHPIAHMFTVIVVLLPLALHSIWGIKRIFSSQPNNQKYGYYANAKYALQRLSAIGLLLFLGAHIWLAMIHPRVVEGHAETFADISAHMHHHLPTLLVYLLGTAGVAYHLSNGLHTAAMGWGVVSSQASMKKLDIIMIATFALLMAMGWGAVFALYQAGVAFPVPTDT